MHPDIVRFDNFSKVVKSERQENYGKKTIFVDTDL